jgi:hypothetical protein
VNLNGPQAKRKEIIENRSKLPPPGSYYLNLVLFPRFKENKIVNIS